jgi:hypothetical protein
MTTHALLAYTTRDERVMFSLRWCMFAFHLLHALLPHRMLIYLINMDQ